MKEMKVDKEEIDNVFYAAVNWVGNFINHIETLANENSSLYERFASYNRVRHILELVQVADECFNSLMRSGALLNKELLNSENNNLDVDISMHPFFLNEENEKSPIEKKLDVLSEIENILDDLRKLK